MMKHVGLDIERSLDESWGKMQRGNVKEYLGWITVGLNSEQNQPKDKDLDGINKTHNRCNIG